MRVIGSERRTEQVDLLAYGRIVRDCHKREYHIGHILPCIAQIDARRRSSARAQIIHGEPCKHRECNLIRAVDNHRPFGGDIFLYKQVGKLLFFEIPDGILLAVILSEYEAREHPLLREINERGGERRTLVEVCKIFLQIVGRELCAQSLHLVLVDGQTLACTSEETRVRE